MLILKNLNNIVNVKAKESLKKKWTNVCIEYNIFNAYYWPTSDAKYRDMYKIIIIFFYY
jgi:hypothetical protein